MATLEKIRNKAVFLTVFIGIALLAFILGDILTQGKSIFGNETTAAVVGDKKIKLQDFQKRYEEANAQMQQRSQDVDQALVQQQVLENMIQEILLDEEVENLDIYVSQEELTEAMVGKNANPMMVQFANQMGAQTPAQLYDMIFNPAKYGVTEEQIAPVKAEWMKRENEMEKSLSYMKLGNLITGTIQANDLDKAALYAENATTSNIAFVKKDYSSISDDEIKKTITEADYKDLYNKNKEQYKLDNETRRIHYIAVNVKPSAADETAAQKIIEDAVATLKASKGVDDIRNNGDLNIQERTVIAKDLTDPTVKEFVINSEVEAVSPVRHIGDTYSLIKVVGKKVDTDSVKINLVAVQGAKATQDSVLNLLNSGAPIAEVNKVKGVESQMDVWQNIMGAGADSKEITDKLLNAGKDYFVMNASEEGAMLVQVIEKKAPKQMYEIAEVSYKVFPSDATVNGLRDNLQNFIATNNNSKDFAEKAIAAGYQATEANVTSDMAQINRIPSSRKAIQWVFGGKEGDVSPIFDKDNNDKMIAVAIDEIIPAGYTPISNKELRENLELEIIHNKKAAKLIAEYKGKSKDLNGYASIMGSKVDSTSVTFAQPFIPMIGMESALLGRVPVAKVGELVGPVKGNTGVYVFQVLNIDNQAPSLTPEQSAGRYAATLGGQAVMQRAVEILRNETEVENDMIKFY